MTKDLSTKIKESSDNTNHVDLESTANYVKRELTYKGPRPLFIEFSGTPKSGKSTIVNGVSLFFRRNKCDVESIVERASTCPITNKQHMYFNIWTANSTLNAMLTAYEKDVDIVIADRGIYDSIVWMNFLRMIGRLKEDELSVIKDFYFFPRWRDLIDIVFVMTVNPREALKREHSKLITKKTGSIMNAKVLQKFNQSLDKTGLQINDYFRKVIHIDTSELDELHTLNSTIRSILMSLTELLDEFIMVFPSESMQQYKAEHVYNPSKEAFGYFEGLISNHTIRKLRRETEDLDDWIQPIICAVFTWNGKILLFKKKEKHKNMRFHGKFMIWAGGHVQEKDIGAEHSPCISCLRRELAEELLFTTEYKPHPLGVLWDQSNPKSRRHLGLVYEVKIPHHHVADTLQNQGDFYERRGKSVSCTFINPEETKMFKDNLELWSKSMLRWHFKVDGLEGPQRLLWDPF